MSKSREIVGLIIGQAAIAIALLVLLDSMLWVVAPIPMGTPPLVTHFTQNLPGLKQQITYEQIESDLRSLSIRSLAEPNRATRILCVGASTTKQHTQETADTWCALLESKLKLASPPLSAEVETLSYGSGGEKAVDTALWLENMLDKIKPDIVITLLGINDLAWNGGPGYQRTDVDTLIQKRNDDEKNKSFLTHAKEMCRNISQLCRRAFVVAKNFSMRRDLQNQKSVEWHSDNMPALRKKYQELPLVDQLTRRPDPIGEFGGAVDWILNFLKKRDKSVIVLGQPVIWKPEMPPEEYKNLWFWMNSSNGPARPSTSWLLQQIQKYNRLQQELAEKYGFSYVDLDAAIPKTLEYYFDDCHYTDKGSARVAEAVLPTLSKVLVAGAPP